MLNSLSRRVRAVTIHDENEDLTSSSSFELVPLEQQAQAQQQQQGGSSTSNPLWYHRSLLFFIGSIVLVNIIRIGISTLDIGKRAAPAATPKNSDADDIWRVGSDTTQQPPEEQAAQQTQPKQRQGSNKTNLISGSSSGGGGGNSETKVKPDALLGLAGSLLPQQQQQQQHITTTIIKQKNILIIGGAGFIGFHISMHLKKLGHVVVVMDLLQSNYYSNDLQHLRSNILQNEFGITVYTTNICEIGMPASTTTTTGRHTNILKKHHITHVIYLAAQPYTLNKTNKDNENTSRSNNATWTTTKLFEYPPNNMDCFATLLDLCKYHDIHLVYAMNHHWNEIKGMYPHHALKEDVNQQRLLAKAYYNLYGLSSIGIYFPTTYGPFGRPDHYYYKLVATTLSSSSSSLPATIELAVTFERQQQQQKSSNNKNSTSTMKKKTMHTSLMFVDDIVRGIVSATDFVFDGSQVFTLGKTCSFSWENVGIPTIVTAATNNGNYNISPPIIEEMDVSSNQPELYAFFKNDLDTTTAKNCQEQANYQIPLSAGMQSFINWYQMEQGERFIDNKTTTTTTTLPLSSLNNENDSFMPFNNNNKQPHHICFVTSMFVEEDEDNTATTVPTTASEESGTEATKDNTKKRNSNNTKKPPHKLSSTTHLDHSLPFLFFAFTNVAAAVEEEEEHDGWERIVLRNLPFKRFVTGTHWPKYMGWKHPKLSTCMAICYSDSSLRPNDLLLSDWMSLVQIVKEESSGIIHQLHPISHVTILSELGVERDGTNGNNNSSNINNGYRGSNNNKSAKSSSGASFKTKEWLLQQNDFDNMATRYKTNAFVYDPSNKNVRELMTTFWAHYSQEKDVSWRDQPLYRYVLGKLKLIPAQFPSLDGDYENGETNSYKNQKRGEIKDFWEEDWEEDMHFLKIHD